MVDSFFGCVNLETFAVFYVTLEIVLYKIDIVLCLILAVGLFVYGVHWISSLILGIVAGICYLLMRICKEMKEGLKTRDPEKMLKYCVYCMVVIILMILGVLGSVADWHNASPKDTTPYEIIVLICLLLLVWQVYVFLCINSLFEKIKAETLPVVQIQSTGAKEYQPVLASPGLSGKA